MSQENSKKTFDVTTTGVAEACGCGASPYENNTRAEARYTAWGTFCLLWGMSAQPRAVAFKCWKCEKVVGETEDAAMVRAHGAP